MKKRQFNRSASSQLNSNSCDKIPLSGKEPSQQTNKETVIQSSAHTASTGASGVCLTVCCSRCWGEALLGSGEDQTVEFFTPLLCQASTLSNTFHILFLFQKTQPMQRDAYRPINYTERERLSSIFPLHSYQTFLAEICWSRSSVPFEQVEVEAELIWSRIISDEATFYSTFSSVSTIRTTVGEIKRTRKVLWQSRSCALLQFVDLSVCVC